MGPTSGRSENASEADQSATATTPTSTTNSVVTPRVHVPEEYFTFDEPSKTAGNSMYRCVRCLGKRISVSDISRYNLDAHMKAFHSSQIPAWKAACQRGTQEKRHAAKVSISSAGTARISTGQGSIPITGETTPSTFRFRQAAITAFAVPRPFAPAPHNQSSIERIILKYLVMSVKPLSEVDNPDFEEFVLSLCQVEKGAIKIPSRYILTDRLEKKFFEAKLALKSLLSNVPAVCTTADAWSSRRRAFLGSTVHWFDPQDLSRKSACLGLKGMTKERHTHDILAGIISGMNKDFDLVGKITCSVTDSGANFVKAFQVFAEPNPAPSAPTCSSSTSPSTVPGQLDEDENSAVDEELEPMEIFEFLDEAEEEQENFEGLSEHNLPPHLKCGSHKLNLVGTKDSAEAAEQGGEYGQLHKSVTAKMRALWNKQQRSPRASGVIFEQLAGLFVVENTTRWNSSFRAFQRVYEFAMRDLGGLNALFRSLKLPFSPFTPKEISFMGEYLMVFEPLVDALDTLQGEGADGGPHPNLGAGYLLPTLTALRLDLADFITGKTPLKYCKPLAETLDKAIAKRFAKELEDPDLLVATAVHPKFRLSCFPEAEHARIIALVKEQALELAGGDPHEEENQVRNLSASPPARAPPSNVFGRRKGSLLSRFENPQPAKRRKTALENEIELYLHQPRCDDLSSLGSLRALFVKRNTALPSSAPVERLFSLAGRVLIPSRTRLSNEHLEMLVFLKANWKLLNLA